MSFPYHYSSSSTPLAAGSGAGVQAPQVPNAPLGTGQAAGSHHGLPPPGVTDGQPATYGYADPAAMDWRADLPELSSAWAAIEKLGNVDVLNSDFGAIDARNQLMLALGIPRAEIDNMRGADNAAQEQQRTIDAMSAFAASSNPDSALLDGPHAPFTLKKVLAMIDRGNVSGCGAFLAPIVTLLVLRERGAGNRYDTAVMAQHSAAITHLKQSFSKAGDVQYATAQARRHEFLQSCANSQATYRQLHENRVPPSAGHLPEPVQQALAKLRNAYQSDMGLEKKAEIVNALEAVFGVGTEASDDVSQTLEQLLQWYQNPGRKTSPPPPALLMGLVIPLGWHDYQDQKCLREGRTVKHTLTGHPALPDALHAALLHYLPAQPTSLSLVGTEAPLPLPPAGEHGSPVTAQLRQLLASVPAPGPLRLAQLIERAIALSGPPWIERIKDKHLAAPQMINELQAGAVDADQRAAFAQAVTSLTNVMQGVVASSDPLSRAFKLDLYRSLGVPASDASRAKRLNTVFFDHPEISAASARQLTEQFAQQMVAHGYSQDQSTALQKTARELVTHWSDSAVTHLRVRQVHEKSLDVVLEQAIAKAGLKVITSPACLGVASAAEMLESLITRHGFTNEMLGKVMRDLHQLQLFGSGATRAQMESRYRTILHPPGGSMAGVPMATAIRKLAGAISTHLTKSTASITDEVSTAFNTLGGPGLPTPELYQLLRYFWRLNANLPVGTATVSLSDLLDKIKGDRCASEDGSPDIARVCEFNNACREVIVKAMTDRVPGFGVVYASALETTTGQGYQATMDAMQAMLNGWAMPDRSY